VREIVQRHESGEPPRPIGIETWIASDESPVGYGSTIRHLHGDWVKLGALVGVKPEQASSWGIGVVRRIIRESETEHHVGVQVLSHAVLPVVLTPVAPLAPAQASRPQRALLLSAVPDENGEIDLALDVGVFSGNGRFATEIGAKPCLLVASQLVEAGDDFDIARFEVRARAAT
jgi:hypothetical protein